MKKKGTSKSKKPKNEDFKKPKLKPGRVLKKTNVTDTRMTVKKVVLIEQLKDKASPITTIRGLTLDDLCRQLGHYNPNVRKDAIAGVYQIISQHTELMNKHLRLIVPSVARLIGDETADNTTRNHLKNLFEVICRVPEVIMESHFPLLVVHLLRALTHMQLAVRIYALKILVMIMKAYGSLCLKNTELFEGFLQLMNSQRRPKDKDLVLSAWKAFLSAYSNENMYKVPECPIDHISFTDSIYQVDLSKHYSSMDFSVLGPNDQVHESPLDSEEKLVYCCEIMCPLLARFLSEEDKPNAIMSDCVSLIQRLIVSIQQFCELNTSDGFKEKIIKAFAPLDRLAKLPMNKSLANCLKRI